MVSGQQAVARGLRLTPRVFWPTVILAVLSVSMFLTPGVFSLSDLLRPTTIGMIYGGINCFTAFAAFVGKIVGFVGRIRCLATPPEFPTARNRIRLAVILEGCGWMGGVTSIGVGVAAAAKVVPLTVSAPAVTVLLSALLLILGRVMFLWYTRSLADVLENDTLARQSARSLLLFVIVSVCGTVGFGLWVFGNWSGWTTTASLAYAMSCGLCLAAAGVGVYGLFVYSRLLRQLSDAASELASQATTVEDAASEGVP